MPYNPNIHHRRSIRLKGYDYSQAGLYFITICVQNRVCLFGDIVNGEMILNDAGQNANACWLNIPEHFPNVVLYEHIVMPNHVHGIIELVGANKHSPDTNSPDKHSPDTNSPDTNSPDTNSPDNHSSQNHSPDNENNHYVGAKNVSPLRSPSKTIGSIVRGYKIGVTKWFRTNSDIGQIWQRNYWERIIREEPSYHRIAAYIINNPKNWSDDKLHKP